MKSIGGRAPCRTPQRVLYGHYCWQSMARHIPMRPSVMGKNTWKKKLQVNTYLILDQELNTLNGSSSGLGDGSGDTTHCYRRLVLWNICRPPSAAIDASIFIETDGDNECKGSGRVSILKKSMTKGGTGEKYVSLMSLMVNRFLSKFSIELSFTTNEARDSTAGPSKHIRAVDRCQLSPIEME